MHEGLNSLSRTHVVWVSFLVAITVVGGVLALSDHQNSHGGFLAANLAAIGETAAADPVFDTAAPIDRRRWKGIVVHHLGAPSGDPAQIHRQHLAIGHQGLGYHFLIGNGNGFGDGVVHAGYRWNEQLPGAHALGPDEAFHNEHSIAICLIGNGDRRPFTERQISQLISLVQRLQRELEIPADSVHVHRDIAIGVHPPVTSPGRYFPSAQLREQLR